MLWTDGSVPFSFGKDGSGVLAYCSLCGTEATLIFSAGSVCSNFYAEACAILQALCWSLQHQQVCHFSSPLALFAPLCPLFHRSFYLNLSGRNCPLSPLLLLGYNGSTDIRFSRGTTRLMRWPDGERNSCTQKSFVVSLLLSLVSTLFFSWTGFALSHLNSLTHRLPRFSSRNLCSLVTLAVFSLVFAARTQASVKLLSL